ncbi:bifunctional phosphopantothenoylcysteine decarboxylase/phosphopantothenate--cysteine ligase CoaBC [uncultured Clostridium sp.]|jgi:phosphopantothenoylcysteine decarboxylase/phosphopantothenate--cysteine ligase|uniref:bifunctional phosphopantothenoylcysteine decarboxylase/phosphopantothenate--cysteine ligase CoaBC n=1 Tax=uncultured Clostridium sp. TaxID=59620 RepID=UPI002619EAC9|nr:bifunctional phosphopantothenoylcysteine decarboxylase/phosphopantothenate--cysteine ligase CoaBC [uncultured Clostridium sp.]
MSKKCVVVGVTGGIAVYKALDIISKLRKADIDVRVIMTKSATEFVTPLSFQAMSQNMVITDMFSEPKAWEIQHISTAQRADLMLIAPATANIIGKVANGIADDMLSTTIMATKSKVVFAPAMNTNMYENRIVQNNIEKLKDYGYEFIAPASGRLACGDIGKGKLADTEEIVEAVLSKLYEIKDLVGKNVIVTAGPTRAEIDPVRFITNKSTGKMGYEIAKEARDRGANVTLISGADAITRPVDVEFIKIDTNEQMYNAIIERFEEADIVIKAAAVADYKPKDYSNVKIKKQEGELLILLERDRDILKTLGDMKTKQILVGFAAESNDLIENATRKLNIKNLDYIVANDIMSSVTGFGSDENKVTILSKDNMIDLSQMSKREVAKNIFDIIKGR